MFSKICLHKCITATINGYLYMHMTYTHFILQTVTSISLYGGEKHRWQDKTDKPSLSALNINVRLFVATSNLSSPTLDILVMKAVEMIPLEYTSYNWTTTIQICSVKHICIGYSACRLYVFVCTRVHAWVCWKPYFNTQECRKGQCNNVIYLVLLPCHCQSISGSQHPASPIVSDNKGLYVGYIQKHNST